MPPHLLWSGLNSPWLHRRSFAWNHKAQWWQVSPALAWGGEGFFPILPSPLLHARSRGSFNPKMCKDVRGRNSILRAAKLNCAKLCFHGLRCHQNTSVEWQLGYTLVNYSPILLYYWWPVVTSVFQALHKLMVHFDDHDQNIQSHPEVRTSATRTCTINIFHDPGREKRKAAHFLKPSVSLAMQI